MHYIVGLGNPGEKYQHTRHNVGWLVLDAWLTATGLPTVYERSQLSGRVTEGLLHNQEVTVLYPDTYMNNSGGAVAKLVPKDEVGQLVVVHDDVDLPFGAIKISVGGGSGGHNGLKSITKSLGTPEYVRLRIGIAPTSFWTGAPKRPAGAKLPAFVLQPFTRKEERQLKEVLATAGKALSAIVKDGPQAAMNQFN
jgi:PTH1 family peptidyl-tRNA hydrolase